MEQAHEEHHLSVWPLVVGVAFLFTYLGFGLIKAPIGLPILGLGLVLVLVSLVGWAREDTKLWPRTFAPTEGRHIGWWGTVYFLATEFMLFGALFAAFFAARGRLGEEAFFADAPHFPILLVTVNTAILVASGFTMHWAQNRIAENDRKKYVIGMVATVVLGGIFLAVQVYEYLNLIREGFVLGGSQFATTFYMLTGTHGLHVFAGLVFIVLLLFRGLAGNFDEGQHVAVEAGTLYWHFVDIVWIFLYVVIYLGWL